MVRRLQMVLMILLSPLRTALEPRWQDMTEKQDLIEKGYPAPCSPGAPKMRAILAVNFYIK
jgi:hypothetical protein